MDFRKVYYTFYEHRINVNNIERNTSIKPNFEVKIDTLVNLIFLIKITPFICHLLLPASKFKFNDLTTSTDRFVLIYHFNVYAKLVFKYIIFYY